MQHTSHDVTAQVRVYLFGRFCAQVRQADGAWQEISTERWGRCSYARCLLNVLLCSPRRTAERGVLLSRIWPDAESDTSLYRLLNNAAYYLRQALQDQGHLLKKTGSRGASGYELADQMLIWTDVDACEELLEQSESLHNDPLLLQATLQEAATYFARGPFLAQEERFWCYGRRAELTRKDYRCRMQLAEICTHLRQFGAAEAIYNALLAENPSAEEALEQLMRLYHRQGLPHLAWRCYQDTCTLVAREEGLPFSPALAELAERLRHATPSLTPAASVPLRTLAAPVGQAAPAPGRHLPALARRAFLQNALSVAGASLLTLDTFGVQPDVLLRLTNALKRPSRTDTMVLEGLEQRMIQYWQYRPRAGSRDLLASVEEYLYKITALLESSSLPDTRDRLCVITAHTALLAGTLYYELGLHVQARPYYKLALEAARQAQNDDLQALVLGWTTFSWTYSHQPYHALVYVQKGSALAQQGHDIVLQSWLAAIEAEIQAHLNHQEACLQALARAEAMESSSLHANRYVLFHSFDDTLFNGYQGACFKRLYDPGDPRSHSLLTRAQQALKQALTTQRKANTLIDFSWTLVQHKEIEEACAYASEALELIEQRQSRTSLQRLLAVRYDLRPWARLTAVQDLDARIGSLRV